MKRLTQRLALRQNLRNRSNTHFWSRPPELIAATPSLTIVSLGSFLKAWFLKSGSQLSLRKGFLPQEQRKASGRAHFFHGLWLG